MTPSRIFLYFCLALITGIFVASLISLSQLSLLGFLIVGIFLISVFWGRKKLIIAGFCLLFFVLGGWRYQSFDSKIVYSKEGRTEFTGIVSKEPDIKNNATKLIINNSLISTARYPEYQYGDKLRVTGFLRVPPIFDDFNYRDYLKKDGIVAVMESPEIELIGSGFGNPIKTALLSFKNKFRETARAYISPPQQGFLEALAFGQESNISQDWKDKLNFTGTRHIAAVSGMNITIISSIIFAFILSLGLKQSQAFYLSIVLLFFYILMIGAPASALRAFIMAGLYLFARHSGRQSSGFRAIVFAATFMLVQNPFLLIKDVGFQLSFLAILGLVALQPPFSYYMKFIPDPKFFPLKTTLAATLSAQVFTLPILIYNFGYFSLISLLANIFIVPILAPVTILIFIFGVSGMVFSPLGLILSWPVWLSLTYVVKIIDWLSHLTFAFFSVENLSWVWLVIFYLILACLIWWYNKSVWQTKHG